MKRLIGRRFDSEEVQRTMELVPYEVIKGNNDDARRQRRQLSELVSVGEPVPLTHIVPEFESWSSALIAMCYLAIGIASYWAAAQRKALEAGRAALAGVNATTDPVKRGKWIRERLLAGTVPDVPITVDASVPEDPHKTLRQRYAVTPLTTCHGPCPNCCPKVSIVTAACVPLARNVCRGRYPGCYAAERWVATLSSRPWRGRR